MKKILIFLMCFYIMPGISAEQIDEVRNDGLDYLRNEISNLEKELAQKTEKLNKCAKKNKNFKIAGATTLGLTGAGVATNIALKSKKETQKKQVEKMNNTINDAYKKVEETMAEFEKMRKNADEECVERQMSQLTKTEKARLKELNNSDWEDFDPDESETDKQLLTKRYKIIYKCQKTKKE